MNKIGIITLNGNFNYGNRLQNYALQEILKGYDFEVETIMIKNEKKSISNGKMKINFFEFTNKIDRKIRYIAHNYFFAKIKQERKLNFKKFTDSYIAESDYFISDSDIPNEKIDSYNYFIVGSDQVWNPEFTNCSPLYFLQFAPKNKRIAYAASFGVSKISSKYKPNYKKWLKEFNGLSVREEDGGKIIEEMTGIKVPVLVDPTLLLNKNQWLSLSTKHINKPEKSYILTYFLGEINDELKKYLNELSRSKNLEIVSLANPKFKKAFTANPSEFIDYIDSADLFLTDSFHGTVFSVILQTPFVVTERNSKGMIMNSRIDTLLKKFQLESRKWNTIKDDFDSIFDVNFVHTIPLIEHERSLALKFLESALDVDSSEKKKTFDRSKNRCECNN